LIGGEAFANESDLLKRFGKTDVKYGFITVNSTRTLGMNTPGEVQMPERGCVSILIPQNESPAENVTNFL